MRKPRVHWALLLCCGLAACAGPAKADKPDDPADVTVDDLLGWPRVHERDGHRVLVHQPQVDQWSDYSRLAVKVAVAVAPAGETKETYGVLHASAATKADFEERLVVIDNVAIQSLTFPNVAPQRSAQLRAIAEATLRRHVTASGTAAVAHQLRRDEGPVGGGGGSRSPSASLGSRGSRSGSSGRS
ncbi:MAG: hypothetical protein ACYTFT_17480 [Planctomycetota bacterium]|jgi:hypothetical protein